MNLPPLNTHPALQDFFSIRMTNTGELRINGNQTVCNETNANEFRPLSACCRSRVNYLDGMPLCSECEEICDAY